MASELTSRMTCDRFKDHMYNHIKKELLTMTDFTKVRANLEERGFQVSCFASAQEAADYLDAKLDGKTVDRKSVV